MSEQKKYLGKGKPVGQYGLLKFGFKTDDIVKLLRENTNASGWVNVIVGTLRETDSKGNTHTCWIDDYKPQQQVKQQHQNTPDPEWVMPDTPQNGSEDLVF
jgi:ribosomal protein L39E